MATKHTLPLLELLHPNTKHILPNFVVRPTFNPSPATRVAVLKRPQNNVLYYSHLKTWPSHGGGAK